MNPDIQNNKYGEMLNPALSRPNSQANSLPSASLQTNLVQTDKNQKDSFWIGIIVIASVLFLICGILIGFFLGKKVSNDEEGDKGNTSVSPSSETGSLSVPSVEEIEEVCKKHGGTIRDEGRESKINEKIDETMMLYVCLGPNSLMSGFSVMVADSDYVDIMQKVVDDGNDIDGQIESSIGEASGIIDFVYGPEKRYSTEIEPIINDENYYLGLMKNNSNSEDYSGYIVAYKNIVAYSNFGETEEDEEILSDLGLWDND